MQILVVYASKTGRTKAMAAAVGEGVQCVEGVTCLLRSASEVQETDFLESDGVIAGSPVYFGTLAATLKDVFDRSIGTRKQMVGKVGAAFATGNHHTGGKETTLLSILQSMLVYGMVIIGDPLESGGHYGVAVSGEPTESALQDARGLGRRVAEMAQKLR